MIVYDQTQTIPRMSVQGHDWETVRDELPILSPEWDPSTKFNEGGMAVPTWNGFNSADASSAYQKAVRRGFGSDAVQWALELFWANRNRRTNVWNRSLVMAVEDIGPASSLVVLQVFYLYEHYPDDPNAIATAALILSQNKKSRVNDWGAHLYPELQKPGATDGYGEPEDMKSNLISALIGKNVGASLLWTDILTYTTKKNPSRAGRRYKVAK